MEINPIFDWLIFEMIINGKWVVAGLAAAICVLTSAIDTMMCVSVCVKEGLTIKYMFCF